MTYNDFLANRVRKAFANKNAAYTETVSFGQLNFLVNDCFCAGVNGEELEIHISPDKVARGLHGRKFRRLDESGRKKRTAACQGVPHAPSFVDFQYLSGSVFPVLPGRSGLLPCFSRLFSGCLLAFPGRSLIFPVCSPDMSDALQVPGFTRSGRQTSRYRNVPYRRRA